MARWKPPVRSAEEIAAEEERYARQLAEQARERAELLSCRRAKLSVYREMRRLLKETEEMERSPSHLTWDVEERDGVWYSVSYYTDGERRWATPHKGEYEAVEEATRLSDEKARLLASQHRPYDRNAYYGPSDDM